MRHARLYGPGPYRKGLGPGIPDATKKEMKYESSLFCHKTS